LRPVFEHRQIIVDRFPVAAVGRFTQCVSIDTPVREHLRELRFCVWTFFVIGKPYQVRFHVPTARSANDQTPFRQTKQDYLTARRLKLRNINGSWSRRLLNRWLVCRIKSGLRWMVEDGMTRAEKRIREYLAKIGRRGGLASRRELTRSHAKQMVAIREAKCAALKAGKPWPPRNRKALKVS